MSFVTHLRIAVLCTWLLLFFATWVRADSFSGQAVRAATDFLNVRAQQLAENYQATQFSIGVEPPPRRIKLPKCPAPPEVQLVTTLTPGRQSVKVLCRERNNQNFLIQAYIRIFLPVIVSTVRIPAGEKVSEYNSDWQIHDISTLSHGYFRSLEQLSEQKAAETIKPDRVLTPLMFLPVADRVLPAPVKLSGTMSGHSH